MEMQSDEVSGGNTDSPEAGEHWTASAEHPCSGNHQQTIMVAKKDCLWQPASASRRSGPGAACGASLINIHPARQWRVRLRRWRQWPWLITIHTTSNLGLLVVRCQWAAHSHDKLLVRSGFRVYYYLLQCPEGVQEAYPGAHLPSQAGGQRCVGGF